MVLADWAAHLLPHAREDVDVLIIGAGPAG
jgi:hypothetical protein